MVGFIGAPTMLYWGSLDGSEATLGVSSTRVPQAEQNATLSAKAVPQSLQNLGIEPCPRIWGLPTGFSGIVPLGSLLLQ
jgi:hypothetical protein